MLATSQFDTFEVDFYIFIYIYLCMYHCNVFVDVSRKFHRIEM